MGGALSMKTQVILRSPERRRYLVSINPDIIQELGWERGDLLEWRMEEDGLKLFLVARVKRKTHRFRPAFGKNKWDSG